MNKLLHNLFDTPGGPAKAMLLVAGVILLVSLVAFLFQNLVDDGLLGIIMAILLMPIWFLTLIAAVAAVVRSLWQRRWKRAAAQLGLCVAAFFALFVVGMLCAVLGPVVSRFAFGAPAP